MTKGITVRRSALARPRLRGTLAAILALSFLLLLAGGATIPFVFESQTMYYKFGLNKTLLRLGKIAGISAALFMGLQLLLGGRFKPLDRIYPLDRLLRLHRVTGLSLLVLAVSHPLLVIVPEGIANLPMGWKFWPEYIGAGLLLLLIPFTLMALFRTNFRIPFHTWRWSHRTGALLALTLLLCHVRFVSETFEQGLPLQLLYLFGALYFSLVLWKLARRYIFPSTWQVARVDSHHAGLHTLSLQPIGRSGLRYLPGQFAFLSLHSSRISQESHPFTLCSSPTRTDGIEFTIRASGDWTARVDAALKGARAVIDGPYGQFSYMLKNNGQGIILIAGGVGITPMMSMLRCMVDSREQLPVSLVWSCRTGKDMVYTGELEAIAAALPHFRFVPHLTGGSRGTGRLDEQKLALLLKGCSTDSTIFVCGPPPFTASLVRQLPRLGFSRRAIHSERFAL